MAGIRRGATALYRYLTPLFFVACIVQIFLAGRGVFAVKTNVKLDKQTSLDPHRALGVVLELAAVVLLLAVLVAWPRRKEWIGWYLALAVLAVVLQPVLSTPSHPWIAGLHPVSGVAILGLSGWLSHRLWRRAEADPASG